MSKLPVCSGNNAVKAFQKAGWVVDRQKGSHITMIKPRVDVVLTIPLHNEIDRRLLGGLIKKSGLSVKEFINLL